MKHSDRKGSNVEYRTERLIIRINPQHVLSYNFLIKYCVVNEQIIKIKTPPYISTYLQKS